MTGGLVSEPFDTIIPVEKAKYFPSKEKPTHIIVDEQVKKFSYIRFAGEDYNLKDVVIKNGELIQPKHIMALTTLGIVEIKAKKQPKIIFFGTGNEIADYKDKNVPSWKVRNSNNHYFTSFGKSLYFQIIDGGIIKDDEPDKLKEELKKTLSSDIDIFVTSGAISAGKFDFIPKLKPDDVIFSVFTPYPGSDLYYECKDSGIIDGDFDLSLYNHQSPLNCFTKNIPKERFYELRKEAVKFVDNYNKKAKYRRVIASLRNIGIKGTWKKIYSHFHSKIVRHTNA